MTKYRPYDKYQDSSVQWIGEIPKHWQVKRVKHLFKIVKRIAGELGHDVLSITQKGIKVKDIKSGGGQLSMDYSKYQFAYKGDFAMNHMDLLTGYVDISNYDGVISPDYRVFSLKDKNCFSKYYLYLFQMGYWNKLFYALGQGSSQLGRWRLAAEEFNLFEFPYPPLPEQKAIANFLDKKTAEIEQFIELKEKTITLLKERKTAIINKAVSKGLDDSVPMQDSGIECLGKIPSHWEVKRFSHGIKLRHGYQFRDYDFKTEGIKVVKITQLSPKGFLDLSKATLIDKNRLSRFQDIIINKGDILMALTGGTIGKIIRVSGVKEPLLQNYRVGAFFPTSQKLLKDYLFHILSSNSFLSQIFKDLSETGQPNIGKEDLSKMYFANPPIKEQIEIVNYIESESLLIDQAITQAEKEITLIKEYQQNLISEAVTGKIDVRALEAIEN